MRRGLFFTIAILFSLMILRSQDAHYNTVDQSLIYLNPSYAGSENCLRNQTNYRNQWPALSGTDLTYQTCFDSYIKEINGGIAFRASSEDQNRGALRRVGIELTYAQYFKLPNRITIVPSVQGSYVQSTLDKGRLNFGDVIDSRYGITWSNYGRIAPWGTFDLPEARVDYINAGAALIVNYQKYLQLGASFANVLQPNISHIGTYRLPIRTTIHARSEYPIDMDSHADVSFVATFQNSYYNIRANLIAIGPYGITCGLGYGESNSYYVLPGMHTLYSKNAKGYLGFSTYRVRLLYSYDQNINASSINMAGSHEISLSILFRKKTDRERLSFKEKNRIFY